MHVRATTYIYLAAFMLLLNGTKAKARDKGNVCPSGLY